MKVTIKFSAIIAGIIAMAILPSCNLLQPPMKQASSAFPTAYHRSVLQGDSVSSAWDTISSGSIPWRQFFADNDLIALIDTALLNNRELNIMQQEILIAKNEIRARKGEYLPFVGAGAGSSVEKTPRYTRNGALEANNNVKPGTAFPDPFTDLAGGFNASWEIDIWNKLHNARNSAAKRYLATVEGRNFMVTQLVAEISSSYYELLSLDNQLEILKRNISILEDAVDIVKLQKVSARVTELAVKKFEAELFQNKSRLYQIQQQIAMAENRINYLCGRFPAPVKRNAAAFNNPGPISVQSGIPLSLLQNRPDIRQAELGMASAKLDVMVAKAAFYPSLRLTAAGGLQAYNAALIANPQSLLFMLAGDLSAPLINRNALKANLGNAKARQVQSVYEYERSMLQAVSEVSTQLSGLVNLNQSYELKTGQVNTLTESITIAFKLFRSARADYMEVLMTQRDGLEAKMELVELRKQLLLTQVNAYKALGGGWR